MNLASGVHLNINLDLLNPLLELVGHVRVAIIASSLREWLIIWTD